jgi:hypothetical protein
LFVFLYSSGKLSGPALVLKFWGNSLGKAVGMIVLSFHSGWNFTITLFGNIFLTRRMQKCIGRSDCFCNWPSRRWQECSDLSTDALVCCHWPPSAG